MWKRFCDSLVCPICSTQLELAAFEESEAAVSPEHIEVAERRGIPTRSLSAVVHSGLLLCRQCKHKYPIYNSLPILMTYQTPVHAAFTRQNSAANGRVGAEYTFPAEQPAIGEEDVRESFSDEWMPYEYDGVIWELNYADHEARLLSEMGPIDVVPERRTFLEVGCGVGLTTYHAQKNFDVDAVGVDLSRAPSKAAIHFKDNPFLHFVQASVFALPFKKQSFDLIYTRGVLHHTYSTERAFQSVASLCRQGGLLYVWLYGPGSISSTPLRLGLYAAERALRPLLSGRSSSLVANVFLVPLAGGYVAFNAMRRLRNPAIQPLNLNRAVHAARDRFTPRFAHRQSSNEVSEWFRSAGFTRVEVVDWRQMPSADHADFKRNTAVRGIR
jgi:SAM-dependent methyltransferase/uncharacterized protein YbaR (Trm112 family)